MKFFCNTNLRSITKTKQKKGIVPFVAMPLKEQFVVFKNGLL